MQKYVYTFVERRDTETYAVTGELPQRGDRVYLAPTMVRVLLCQPADDWIEFQVASVDRVLETSGERVRVVLDRAPIAASQADDVRPETVQPERMAADACPFEATGEIQPDADSTSPTPPTNPLEELRKFAASIDHKLHTPSDSHVQIRKGTKVLLDWWPTTHKTRNGNKRGPDCASAADVIEFLKGL